MIQKTINMHFIQNRISMITKTFLLVIFIIFSSIISAQEHKYLGTEQNITQEELLAKAVNIDFTAESFHEVYKDSKNTYYVLSTKILKNRMVKIKILELISRDDKLVNIGASPDSEYNLFLVNNSLKKSSDQVLKIMYGYIKQSKNEVSQLTEEQQQQWLLDSDKYSKKK